jgi:hypothetical protein
LIDYFVVQVMNEVMIARKMVDARKTKNLSILTLDE